MAVTDELSAPSDRVIQFRLKKPFPLLPVALAKPSSYCPVMPERLARTPANQQVTEMVGSGPFRFIAANAWPAPAPCTRNSQATFPAPAAHPPSPPGRSWSTWTASSGTPFPTPAPHPPPCNAARSTGGNSPPPT